MEGTRVFTVTWGWQLYKAVVSVLARALECCLDTPRGFGDARTLKDDDPKFRVGKKTGRREETRV